jgi:UDP-glucose 4-epimerase
MRIAVTGALGHIGSYLIRDLAQKQLAHEIIMVDDLSTQRYSSLFNLKASATYQFVHGDILKLDLHKILEGVDTVIHLAAITDAAGSFNIKDKVEQNLVLTQKVAEACCETGAALIFPSTTSVYGTQKELVSEDCSQEDLKPQSPYAETKLREEELLTTLGKSGNLKHIICRFGTIFGTSPGMRFHTAVNKFCWQAAMGEPLTVWETALDQKRPYLDIFDASRAIEFIIQKRIFDAKIYNVLTLNSTVRNITDIIRDIIPTLKIELTQSKIMNQLSYEVANSRFRDLHFEFKGDLRKSIRETLSLLTPS